MTWLTITATVVRTCTQTTPLTFPQANLAAIQKKLLDFNKALSENPVGATLLERPIVNLA